MMWTIFDNQKCLSHTIYAFDCFRSIQESIRDVLFIVYTLCAPFISLFLGIAAVGTKNEVSRFFGIYLSVIEIIFMIFLIIGNKRI